MQPELGETGSPFMMADMPVLSEASEIDFQCPVPNILVDSSNGGFPITVFLWCDWTFALTALFLAA